MDNTVIDKSCDAQSPLVSVIMPSFNSSKHIVEAIASIQAQTFESWELLVTDDCSTDNTVEIVTEIAADDSRVKLFKFAVNSGAAKARNNSLANAKGRYVAYLDSDDLWYPQKLEKQIAFMKKSGARFSCASYEVIDESGKPMGKTVTMLDRCDYMGFLTHNLLQTVGIMVDTSAVDKKLLVMPDLRRRQDAATWLQVLKAGCECYGLREPLCGYRRVPGSLSSDKVKAAKGVWFLYRGVEKLSLPVAAYCFVRYAFLAVWKRIYSPSQRGQSSLKSSEGES